VALRTENDALAAELGVLQSALVPVRGGDTTPFALADAANTELSRLMAEYALFIASLRALSTPYTFVVGRWSVNHVVAAEAVDACRYESRRLLTLPSSSAEGWSRDCALARLATGAFSVPVEVLNTPTLRSELRLMPRPDGGMFVRQDTVADAAAAGNDARGVRDCFMASMIDMTAAIRLHQRDAEKPVEIDAAEPADAGSRAAAANAAWGAGHRDRHVYFGPKVNKRI